MTKLFIILILIIIIFNLFTALAALIRNKGNKQVAKSLSWRIGLSIALFILLILSYFAGILEPHGLRSFSESSEPARVETLDPSITIPTSPAS